MRKPKKPLNIIRTERFVHSPEEFAVIWDRWASMLAAHVAKGDYVLLEDEPYPVEGGDA